MKEVYRYNVTSREARTFNNCSSEKNPNNLKFYANNMAYADKYKFIYNEDGEVVAECVLEIAYVDISNLFDMNAHFKSLATYNDYIAEEIGQQMRDYTRYMNDAKKASERKMWANQIEALKNREQELITWLINSEFQSLSDFNRQNDLVAELKKLGYNGYKTKNEIVIF